MARRPGSSIVTYEEHQRRADAAEALFPEMQRKITKARWGRAADGVGDSGLYGDDIVLWSKRQAELLRRMAAGERVDDQIDWPNVIEEIEDVGRSELRAVRAARVEGRGSSGEPVPRPWYTGVAGPARSSSSGG